MFSGNFLRIAQRVYLFTWSGAIFLRAGALRPLVSCFIHVFIMLGTSSEAVACMRHNICTAFSSDYTTTSLTVHAYHVACMSYLGLYSNDARYGTVLQLTVWKNRNVAHSCKSSSKSRYQCLNASVSSELLSSISNGNYICSLSHAGRQVKVAA
jgi:hypothetical protein